MLPEKTEQNAVVNVGHVGVYLLDLVCLHLQQETAALRRGCAAPYCLCGCGQSSYLCSSHLYNGVIVVYFIAL